MKSKLDNIKGLYLLLSGIFIASAIGIQAFSIETNLVNFVQYIQKIVLTDSGGATGQTGIVLDGIDKELYVGRRIGIGEENPGASLHIKATSTGQYSKTFYISNVNGDARLFVEQSLEGDNQPYHLYMRNTGNQTTVRVSPQGVSYFNGGDVGIGTTSPEDKLDVYGNIRVSSTGYSAIVFNHITGENESDISLVRSGVLKGLFRMNTDNDGGTFEFQNRSGSIHSSLKINGNGNVGIGTTSPSEKLEVDGAVVVGDTSTNTAGAIKFSGNNFYGYNGTTRVQLDN